MIRVFIADSDENDIRKISASIASIEGYEIVGSCLSGQKLEEEIAKDSFQLLIVEAELADIKTVEILRKIRNEKRKLDILIVTKSNDAMMLTRFLHYGILDFIIKPFEKRRLCKTLEKYGERCRVMQTDETVFCQSFIDKYIFGERQFSILKGLHPYVLPKGIQGATLKKLYNSLAAEEEMVSVKKIVEKTGLSQPVARKYLRYLEDSNRLTLGLIKGGNGRPKKSYKLKKV